MAIFDAHIKQAESNLRLATHLHQQTGYPDWFVTVCFYSAVHLVEAVIFIEKPIACVLADKSRISSNQIMHSADVKGLDNGKVKNSRMSEKSTHAYRSQIIQMNKDYFGDDFYDAYDTLYQYSHASRYDCYSNCDADVPIVRECMKTICDHINFCYKLSLSL